MNKNPEGKGVYTELGHYLGLGINLAVTIVVFVYVGKWLDDKYNGGKAFYLLICAGLGLFSGLYSFIKTVLNLEKKSRK